MLKKILIGVLALILIAIGLGALSGMPTANATKVQPGSSMNAPIVVDSPSEVPADAVVEKIKLLPGCDIDTFWKLTIPGSDETSHQEFRYLREVPAQEETSHQEWRVKERTRTFTPAQEETSHQVYSYKKSVKDYITEYHFRKFTQTREGVKHGNNITWGAFGPWTPWEPETHTSWETSNAPLGSPAPHADGHNGNQYWERVWQAQFDGETRQTQSGSHFEYSGEVTSPLGGQWVLLPGYPKKVVDTEATEASYGEWSGWELTQDNLLEQPLVPENTDTHEYKVIGPQTFVDSEYVPGYTEYFVLGGEPSLNEADASWVTPEVVPAEQGWTQFDERTVVDEEGIAPRDVFYVFHQKQVCGKPEKPEPPVKITHHEVVKVPVIINAGL